MPDASKKVPIYNLEARLRALSNLDNSYVIGLFDCSRDAYDEGMFPPQEATRGGDGNEEREVMVEKGGNLFLIFGCKAKE